MNFKTNYLVQSVLAISVLAALNACSTNRAQETDYRRPEYNAGYDGYQRPALRQPVRALPDESQQTIQSLAARIRFLERKLAAVTGYTPEDLRGVDDSLAPAVQTSRPTRRSLQAPPSFVSTEPPRTQTDSRARVAPRESVQPSYSRQEPSRRAGAAPAPARRQESIQAPAPQQRTEARPRDTRPWYEQGTESTSNTRVRNGRRVATPSLIPVAYRQTAQTYESSAPRYDLYYRFGSQEESNALVTKLARTHVQTKPLRIGGQHLVQVGSFAAEEPARIRRQYLYSFVGIAPELRLHHP